jgi:hypothetical protein
MTSKEFVIWFKGFTEGVHEYNVTPKQWDLLKSKLEEVNDHPYSISVGTGGYGTINTSTTFTTGSGAWHYTNTTQNLDKNEGTTNHLS